ncbi:hypothetical protein TOT_010001175 [Theileria orientalis strain Shintoku]|uniref:Uncharacterized protein n=1 Tax=Theileria orientalis strain Shintoku TaxID=869250 RepID=J4C329_THEOR|nr:hypothetical protein TOT_010001175 [Theileria orientalis strain Shintoku]BAM39721.1 hypothetical protein TOT_010001175 [Theileria orientalis strain Shintoku]|eukprot:XP_009690022.1 hypothetical protein TOT_010001175 [Theileria orientalis strain Shintoku]
MGNRLLNVGMGVLAERDNDTRGMGTVITSDLTAPAPGTLTSGLSAS